MTMFFKRFTVFYEEISEKNVSDSKKSIKYFLGFDSNC